MLDKKALLQIISQNSASVELHCSGAWSHDTIGEVKKQLLSLDENDNLSDILFDFTGAELFDSAGMLLIVETINKNVAHGAAVTFINMLPIHQRMLVFYRKYYVSSNNLHDASTSNFFEKIGKTICDSLNNFNAFIEFIGQSVWHLLLMFRFPSRFRFDALVKHLYSSGFQAIPIIVVTSFLVGLVVAYQGSMQLQKFGANIFIVEMVSISVFRELAPMLTAIVVAGRSASAYTAQIGTMKITEEIDAMRTLGFHPFDFLVLPRMLALSFAMPLIVFLADIVGVFGGMLVAKMQLGLSFAEFIGRLHAEVELKNIIIGLVKAPIFGLLIASIGCFRGFAVTGSTDSIGTQTTVSVVNAIFWVIAVNALISVMLTEFGI